MKRYKITSTDRQSTDRQGYTTKPVGIEESNKWEDDGWNIKNKQGLTGWYIPELTSTISMPNNKKDIIERVIFCNLKWMKKDGVMKVTDHTTYV